MTKTFLFIILLSIFFPFVSKPYPPEMKAWSGINVLHRENAEEDAKILGVKIVIIKDETGCRGWNLKDVLCVPVLENPNHIPYWLEFNPDYKGYALLFYHPSLGKAENILTPEEGVMWYIYFHNKYPNITWVVGNERADYNWQKTFLDYCIAHPVCEKPENMGYLWYSNNYWDLQNMFWWMVFDSSDYDIKVWVTEVFVINGSNPLLEQQLRSITENVNPYFAMWAYNPNRYTLGDDIFPDDPKWMFPAIRQDNILTDQGKLVRKYR